MKYLIINSHPYDGSFNVAAIKNIKEKLEKNNNTAKIINLVKDGFNPVMLEDDLRLWGKGESADPKVVEYQKDIKEADVLVFAFPIWWGNMPAVLKGFCDKVLLPGFAYRYGDKGEMIGLLTDKEAVCITTMETPNDFFENYFRNPVDGAFIKDTLQTCGFSVTKTMFIDKIVSGGKEYTQTKMNEVLDLF